MTVCHGTPACVMLGFHPLMRYTVSFLLWSSQQRMSLVTIICYSIVEGEGREYLRIFAVLNFLKQNFQHVLEKKATI